MFCKNCGKELPDGARFCDGCGSATETSASPIATVKKKWNLNKKATAIILAGVLCTIGVIFGVVLISSLFSDGYSSPEKAASDAVLGAYAGDSEKLVNTYPDFLVRKYAERMDVPADKKSLIKAYKEHGYYDDPYDSEIKVIDSYAEDNDRYLKEYEEGLFEDDQYGASRSELKSIEGTCMVTVVVQWGERGSGTQEIGVFCIKMDGKWYAVDIT